jgi:hypothetical protein
MSKPGRMIAVSAGSLATLLTSDPTWLTATAAIIAVGAVVTLVQRLRATVSELGRAG